jgi:hypothetical protein
MAKEARADPAEKQVILNFSANTDTDVSVDSDDDFDEDDGLQEECDRYELEVCRELGIEYLYWHSKAMCHRK